VSQPQLEWNEDRDELQRQIDNLKQDLEDARAATQRARDQSAAANRALTNIRKQFEPWYRALRALFGELDAAGIGATSENGASNSPLDSSRYQPWKDKFPGQAATAIDILAKYEAGLTRKQLAGFLRVEPGSGTMSQIIFKLNKAELIDKDGNIIRLRRL
jgi:FtsZ-binding cell division protein ZapB